MARKRLNCELTYHALLIALLYAIRYFSCMWWQCHLFSLWIYSTQ